MWVTQNVKVSASHETIEDSSESISTKLESDRNHLRNATTIWFASPYLFYIFIVIRTHEGGTKGYADRF
jgi:hypothetical protein